MDPLPHGLVYILSHDMLFEKMLNRDLLQDKSHATWMTLSANMHS